MKISTGLLLALFALPVHCEPVGPTEFDMAGVRWQLIAHYQSSLTYNGGALVVPVENKVFYLPGGNDEPLAVLQLQSATSSVGTRVSWVSDSCPASRPRYHTADYGTNQTGQTRQCLIVNSSFAPLNFFLPDSPTLAAMRTHKIALSQLNHSIRSVYGTSRGDYFHVNLMTTQKFPGLPGVQAQAPDTHGVPPALAAWGEALHKAVTDSALSMSRRFVLPPLR